MMYDIMREGLDVIAVLELFIGNTKLWNEICGYS